MTISTDLPPTRARRAPDTLPAILGQRTSSAAAPVRPIRVALLERSELTRAGLTALLTPYDDIALGAAPQPGVTPPADVTLFDTELPLTVDAVRSLVEHPQTGRVVLFSSHRSMGDVRVALAAGARGFLPKSLPASTLAQSLHRIVAGDVVVLRPRSAADDVATRVGLTRREQQIAELIATGIGNAEIAELTHLSLNTVKSYIRTAYRKMGVTTRPQAVAWVLSSLHGQQADGLSA
ncbi:MAG: response regulator transcription factor [Nocardioides sp.]|nr:response regulator transcription factor [Nocardioides sp.]